ncbi:MAG: tetratricopeptide repeat protein [Nitrospiraceae bacterium]
MVLRHIAHATLLLLLGASLLAGLPAVADTPQSKLGKIEFPTSGSEHAQRHFLRGVLALHSFWYEEALTAFQESTKADPDFMMGYWGEAMAHNHPVWEEQDSQAARKVLEQVRENAKVTPRERAYLNAVKLLYGEGDKLTRDRAYADAMEQLYRDYPEDLEAASFYALSLLGTVRPSDRSHRRQIQAGAIALEVSRKNPDHPGAAHYTIHAFDDPDHAILALPAARRYAEIAPEAHHARHMPAHIFLQLGMWPEADASNESGWTTSVEWAKRKGLPINLRDYHSLHWLLYVSLQQARYKKSEEVLALKQQDMREAGEDRRATESGYERPVSLLYDEMAGAFVVETQRWDSAATLWDVPGLKLHDRSKALPIFIRGLAAAMVGRPEADKHLAALRALGQKQSPKSQAHRAHRRTTEEIMELELTAATFSSKGNYAKAIALMKKATALEEALPAPSGPPDTVKPAHELFGDILLRAGRPKEAAQQFSTALARHPNRARALLGAARAAAKSGDSRGAITAYSKLLQVWAQADAELPELREARAYVQQAGTR